MMDFIIMTVSIALGIILAMVGTCVLMAQPWAMKAYSKYVYKLMGYMDKAFKDDI